LARLLRDLLPAAALVVVLAAIAVAQPGQPVRAGVEVSGPLYTLYRFNLTNCFYRDMNISLTMSMENLLSPAPPPRCPDWAPVDGSLACSCRLEPATWWRNATWLLELPPGGTWSTTVETTVPGEAGLGAHRVGYGCGCWWRGWCLSRTVVHTSVSWVCGTTTVTQCWPTGCETYTTPVTCYSPTSTTTTTTVTTTLSTAATAAGNVTVLPREVNQSLIGLDLNVSLVDVLVDYPWPGWSSALVNLTAAVYNLGLGARAGNETLVPMERGMLLLHNLTVLVDNVPVITCRGFCAPAHRIPVNESNATLEPSARGSAELILEPPGEPTNKYTFNVTMCYTEDVNSTPRRTCTSQNITVPLPFGWRLVYNILDNCQPLQQLWEIVPPNETGYKTVVWDTVKPGLREENYCIVASAGACEPVRLEVRQGGVLAASSAGRGSATWCPMEPGTYTAVAVDGFNNTAVKVFTLTWSAGPPPALKHALLSLAAVLIAFMVVLYIVMGGGWPLRGP